MDLRAEAHARLRLAELRELLAACDALTAACEAAGARPLVGLRTMLQVRDLALRPRLRCLA